LNPLLQRLSVGPATDDRNRRNLPEPADADDRSRSGLHPPSVPSTTARGPSNGERAPLVQTPVASSAGECDQAPLLQACSAPAMGDCDADDSNQDLFQLKAPPARVSCTTPLRPGRYEVKFTAGHSMHVTLERLKALLRHQVPDGDLGTILERAANLLLEKTMKERFAQNRPRRMGVRSSKPSGVISSQPNASISDAVPTEPTASTADTIRTEPTASMAGAVPTEPTASITDAVRAAPTASMAGAVRTEPTASTPRIENAKPREVPANVRPAQAHSRYVPRAVVREVYERDGERCTFVSSDGRRCTEQGFLELHHHDTPYASGGAATAANLRTMCRTHNALLGEREFGRAFMQSKLAQARLRRRNSKNEQVPERQQE
jgi:hypothetical protein